MLSAGCCFRNDWMDTPAAINLMEQWCQVPHLTPQHWNTVEPVNRPFDSTNLRECATYLAAANDAALRSSLLLERKKAPRFWGEIALHRQPRHNEVFIGIDTPWPSGETKLAAFIGTSISKTSADFGYITDGREEDIEYFKELDAPYTPEEIRLGVRRSSPFIPEHGKDGVTRYWYAPYVEDMCGPHGHLWDIVWYNYFGPPYVNLIGRDRLTNAGWAHVEGKAGGLECYVTERIDDPSLRERRAAIRDALHEFVWTPGCKREEKRAPVFDFSAQLAQAPKPTDDEAGPVVVFRGLSKKEQAQAIKALEEQTGKEFDHTSRSLKPKRKKN